MSADSKTLALAAALAQLDAPRSVSAAASAKEALSRKCPRFVPNPAPILPFLNADAQLRQIVEGLPASVEAFTTDGGVSYGFRKASAAQVKRVAA
jgi:hypothetical protein